MNTTQVLYMFPQKFKLLWILNRHSWNFRLCRYHVCWFPKVEHDARCLYKTSKESNRWYYDITTRVCLATWRSFYEDLFNWMKYDDLNIFHVIWPIICRHQDLNQRLAPRFPVAWPDSTSTHRGLPYPQSIFLSFLRIN